MIKKILPVLIVSLSACTSSDSENTPTGNQSDQNANLPIAEPEFEDITWTVKSIESDNGTSLLLESESTQDISVSFESATGDIVGQVYCNSMSGHYVYTHGYLVVDNLSSTDASCNENSSEISFRTLFIEALSGSRQNNVSVEGCTLLIQSNDYSLTFTEASQACLVMD